MPPVYIGVGGLVLRGHKGDLVRFFELPPTETLRGDFHCALRKRVLLQGRMYVFDHYVCFYSAVFGFAKKRRINMRTIVNAMDSAESPMSRAEGLEADHEHSVGVGRLLLSLGGRLADGARGLLESGIDVLLNLTQCQATPQMRFFTAVVVLMFAVNLVCMLGYVWPTGAVHGGGETSLPYRAAPAPGGGAAADLAAAAASAAGSFGGSSFGGFGGGGGGGGGEMSYWAGRVALLQAEMQLLQGRLETVSREVGLVVGHLAALSAAAGEAVAAAAAGAATGDGTAAAAAAEAVAEAVAAVSREL
ncbi:GRAM domain-containing protein 1C [Tetrabaena socialis]|uniref:GRAM domain-containing protein 1C n=1 Tax=Tetrabaena socialis TaxID=47790 RepID=A0A2J8AB38_9CHLO|nr:GRAM domain-containing protein 1C [Tetrabaena socialis]|eukprot:PNH09736.1 GRAM domain-containing protein 1C [Tetrabaena socialis]